MSMLAKVFRNAVFASLCAQSAAAQTDFAWDFEDVNASAGQVNVFELSFDFFDRNIFGIGFQIGTSVDVYDTRITFGDHVVPPNGDHNVLMISPRPSPDDPPPEPPFTFAFLFSEPVNYFSVERPAISGDATSPFVHPAWTLEAFADDLSAPVATAGEGSTIATSFVNKATVAVSAPLIRSVRIITQGGEASVPGVLVDGFAMQTVPACDPIDFNRDGLFPDAQDVVDFLIVFSGGACPTPTCGDIDFNNDGLQPDSGDIDSLLEAFAGGPCP